MVKRRKKKSRGQPKRRHTDRLRWMPEVSGKGELFLRRRDLPESGGRDDINYPFSQGLTFVARRWRNLMNEG
jgi:hypothetical protein